MEVDVLPRPRKPLKTDQELFIYGFSGSLASFLIQPLEVAKSRMQTAGEGLGRSHIKGVMHTLRGVYRMDGITGVWMGTEAAMYKQFQFNFISLAVYINIANTIKENRGWAGKLTYLENLGLSLGSSMVGAFVSTPTEIILVRYTLDRKYLYEHRRLYAHTFIGIKRIYSEEGMSALYRGVIPTVLRAGILQATALSLQPPVHDLIKQTTGVEDPMLLQLGTGLAITPLAAALSLPFDVAKTRLQNLRLIKGESDIPGQPVYTGMRDVMKQIVAKEGWSCLWAGYLPYMLRVSFVVTMTVLLVSDGREWFHWMSDVSNTTDYRSGYQERLERHRRELGSVKNRDTDKERPHRGIWGE